MFWLIAPTSAFSLTMFLLVVKEFLIEENNMGYGYYISVEQEITLVFLLSFLLLKNHTYDTELFQRETIGKEWKSLCLQDLPPIQ